MALFLGSKAICPRNGNMYRKQSITTDLSFWIIHLEKHPAIMYRDYFPIIYSCRLRNAKNGETSIVKHEQEIRLAYFEDKDTPVLERLGKVEMVQQLNLF